MFRAEFLGLLVSPTDLDPSIVTVRELIAFAVRGILRLACNRVQTSFLCAYARVSYR